MEDLIKQLSAMSDFSEVQGTKAFKNWMDETGSTEEDGVLMFFSMPPEASIAILKLHIK